MLALESVLSAGDILVVSDKLAKESIAGFSDSGDRVKVFPAEWLPDNFCHTDRKIAIRNTPLVLTIIDGVKFFLIE